MQRTAKEETAHWQAATQTATYLPCDTCVTHLITIYYFTMNRFWNRGVQVIREQSVMAGGRYMLLGRVLVLRLLMLSFSQKDCLLSAGASEMTHGSMDRHLIEWCSSPKAHLLGYWRECIEGHHTSHHSSLCPIALYKNSVPASRWRPM